MTDRAFVPRESIADALGAAEITDELIRQLQTGKHRAVRVNYANGDMVGHTGNYEAAIQAIEVL